MIRNILTTLLAVFALNAFAAVDANQASPSELQTVKGIGPGLSGKIVAARKSAAFKDWSDLLERVSGVGPGNAARFSQAGLTVAGNPYQVLAGSTPTKSGDKANKSPRSSKTPKAETSDKR